MPTTVSGFQALARSLSGLAEGPGLERARREAAERILERARRSLRAIGSEEAERIAASLQLVLRPDGSLEVGTADADGTALELGGLDHAASPWLQPAFEQSLPEIRQGLRRALIQDLKTKNEVRR
ncbi:MAG: hypothetical protein AAF441_03790 [Pseudomonadota bacterium]